MRLWLFLFLLCANMAHAQQSDTIVDVQSGTYGVLPAGQLLVTPAGGTQKTLANALSGAGLSPTAVPPHNTVQSTLLSGTAYVKGY